MRKKEGRKGRIERDEEGKRERGKMKGKEINTKKVGKWEKIRQWEKQEENEREKSEEERV